MFPKTQNTNFSAATCHFNLKKHVDSESVQVVCLTGKELKGFLRLLLFRRKFQQADWQFYPKISQKVCSQKTFSIQTEFLSKISQKFPLPFQISHTQFSDGPVISCHVFSIDIKFLTEEPLALQIVIDTAQHSIASFEGATLISSVH